MPKIRIGCYWLHTLLLEHASHAPRKLSRVVAVGLLEVDPAVEVLWMIQLEMSALAEQHALQVPVATCDEYEVEGLV